MLDDISSSFLFLLGGGVLLGGALSLGMSQAPFDYYAYMDDPVTGRDARFWMNLACACPRLSLLRLRLGTPFPQGFPMARKQVEHVAGMSGIDFLAQLIICPANQIIHLMSAVAGVTDTFVMNSTLVIMWLGMLTNAVVIFTKVTQLPQGPGLRFWEAKFVAVLLNLALFLVVGVLMESFCYFNSLFGYYVIENISPFFVIKLFSRLRPVFSVLGLIFSLLGLKESVAPSAHRNAFNFNHYRVW